MQVDQISARITIAGHSLDRALNTSASQIVFDDQRLRGWANVTNGSTTQPTAPSLNTATLQSGGTLTTGTPYYWVVTSACTAAGSAQSVSSNACTLTPTSLNKSASLSWSPTTGSYYIYRAANNAIFNGLTLVGSTTNASFLDNGITASPGFPPLPIPYNFDVGYDSASQLWRSRTNSNNTLQVASALTADTPMWSNNLITQSAIAGWGTALYITSPTNIDVFFCLPTTNASTIIATSNYNGATWSASAAVYTTGSQPPKSIIQMSAPAASLLFFTDSSGGTWVIKYSKKSGGTWQTPVTWDLGSVNLGVTNSGVALSGLGNVFSTLTSVAIGSDVLLSFYASAPLGKGSRGLYTILVSNITTTSAFWRGLNALHTQATAFAGTAREIFLTHPTLQSVGGNYWILALQSSGFAGNAIQKLIALYSADGKHWADRLILAGTDFTSATYLFSDLVYDKLIVAGNRLFLMSYDKIFRAQATSLVGATNTAMVVDVTGNTTQWSWSRPSAGQVAQGTTTVINDNQQYNGSSILRRGARLVRKCGYVTTSGAELLTLATEIVTRVEQTTRMTMDRIENILVVQTRDYIDKLAKWSSDTFVEFFSGHHVNIGTTSFPTNPATNVPQTAHGVGNLTALSVWNGTWFIAGNEAHCGIIDTNSFFLDNVAVVNVLPAQDSIMEVFFENFSTTGSWSGVYFGIIFQAYDNTHYYAALYNYDGDSKFRIIQAVPVTGGTHNIVYQGTTSGVLVTLNANQYYWLRLIQLYGTVSVFYSTNRQTWTQISTTTGLPALASFCGFVAKGNLTIAQPVGQGTDAGDSNRRVDLLGWDGGGYHYRVDTVVRVQAGSTGIVRSISANLVWLLSGFNVKPSDTGIGLLKDDGTGLFPADPSDSSKILFQTTLSYASIPLDKNPGTVTWTTVPVTGSVQVSAGAYYWIWVYSVSGQPSNVVDQSDIISLRYYPSGGSTYRSLVAFGRAMNQTPTWILIGNYDRNGAGMPPADAAFNATLNVSLNSSGPVISAFNYTSGEPPKTTEYIASHIAARAGMTTTSFDSTITDAFSTYSAGADGTANNWNSSTCGVFSASTGQMTGYHTAASYFMMRSNSTKGLIDDTIVDCDFTLAASNVRAGFGLRLLGDPAAQSGMSGYYLELAPSSIGSTPNAYNAANLYEITNGSFLKLYSAPTTLNFPTASPFHVTIVNKSNFFRLYINDNIVTQFYDTLTTQQGYVGMIGYSSFASGSVAAWDNYRIPDIQDVQDYFAIQKKEKGRAALERLIGGLSRIKYSARYDGALRMSRYNGRTSQDTYQSTMIEGTLTDSDDSWLSDVEAEGETLWARRFAPNLEETDGHRYSTVMVNNATTDVQAYNSEATAIRNAEEVANQYSFTSPAVPAAEIEDEITIVNSQDATNANYIVNDIQIEEDLESAKFSQKLGLRKFVS